MSLVIAGTSCYGQPKKKSHLSITPGADFNRVRAQDSNGTTVSFPRATNFRIGALFEFPFESDKWAIMLEPTYQQYKAARPYPLTYRSLEIPFGFRRYLRVNDRSSIFINTMMVPDFALRHTMELTPNVNFEASGVKANFAAGIGVARRGFVVEYRYYTQRNRRDDRGSFTYNYNKQSIIVGYRLY